MVPDRQKQVRPGRADLLKAIRCFSTLLLLPLCSGCGDTDKARPLAVPAGDPELAAAIDEARRTLPEFFAVLDKPRDDVSGLALKLELTDANGNEFLWLNAIRYKEGKLVGTVNNQPYVVRSVKYGEQVEIDPAKIRDWLFVRGGKVHGNHTARVLVRRLPRGLAATIQAKLAIPATQGSGKD
jgi:uncharacterized protein YegJ (DUF2314 family)